MLPHSAGFSGERLTGKCLWPNLQDRTDVFSSVERLRRARASPRWRGDFKRDGTCARRMRDRLLVDQSRRRRRGSRRARQFHARKSRVLDGRHQRNPNDLQRLQHARHGLCPVGQYRRRSPTSARRSSWTQQCGGLHQPGAGRAAGDRDDLALADFNQAIRSIPTTPRPISAAPTDYARKDTTTKPHADLNQCHPAEAGGPKPFHARGLITSARRRAGSRDPGFRQRDRPRPFAAAPYEARGESFLKQAN